MVLGFFLVFDLRSVKRVKRHSYGLRTTGLISRSSTLSRSELSIVLYNLQDGHGIEAKDTLDVKAHPFWSRSSYSKHPRTKFAGLTLRSETGMSRYYFAMSRLVNSSYYRGKRALLSWTTHLWLLRDRDGVLRLHMNSSR